MSQLQLAALASAAMPHVSVASVRALAMPNLTDEKLEISQAVVQDTSGKLYDVMASRTKKGHERLESRAKAARVLRDVPQIEALGFAVDRVAAFMPADQEHGMDIILLVTTHHEVDDLALSLLTLDDCAAMGTAIGAIHRVYPNFIEEHGYPVHTTGQIRSQLTAWIRQLRAAGHIPHEITDSWSRIMDTDGLWSFTTCPVHGGFEDGDVLFNGSTISAITNWQHMQINDPARDLAWIYQYLDPGHRNAVLSAYGRMLGSRLDDLIMLRANLWLQMEQVGDFLQALRLADNTKIMQFKAQVDRLAHQLGVVTSRSSQRHASAKAPHTITVGRLLNDSNDDTNATVAANAASSAQSPAQSRTDVYRQPFANDDTGETDRTGSSEIQASEVMPSDSTADRPVANVENTTGEPNDSTANAPVAHNVAGESSPTLAITPDMAALAKERSGDFTDNSMIDNDDTFGTNKQVDSDQTQDSPATVVIPLLEREEQAIRHAQEGFSA